MRQTRLNRTVRTLLAALWLGAGLMPCAATAQTAQTATAAPDSLNETYGAWAMQCGAGLKDCRVDQALYAKDKKTVLARVMLFRPGGHDGALVLRALTPLGAKLKPGSSMQVDKGAKVRMPFLTCLDRGCLSETELTPAMEAALRAGTTLAVMIIEPSKGKTIRFELALDGAGRALDRLGGL